MSLSLPQSVSPQKHFGSWHPTQMGREAREDAVEDILYAKTRQAHRGESRETLPANTAPIIIMVDLSREGIIPSSCLSPFTPYDSRLRASV